MRRSILGVCGCGVAALLLACPGGAPADEIDIGASREMVIEALGEPSGTVTVAVVEFLQFRRGTVELKDGKVVSSTVVSEAEHQRRVEAERVRAEKQRRKAEERRVRLQHEGTETKRQVLEDGSVANRSTADQVKYWQSFTRKYPGVDVSTELSVAKKKLAEERKLAAEEEKRRQQELAEAEANKGPPPGLSSRQLRKYKRGRRTIETK